VDEIIYEVHFRRPGDAEARVKWFRILTGEDDHDQDWLVGSLVDLGWKVLAVIPRPVEFL
jgi:hypothetical protein